MLWKRLYGNDIWAHHIDELEGFSTTLSLIYLEFYFVDISWLIQYLCLLLLHSSFVLWVNICFLVRFSLHVIGQSESHEFYFSYLINYQLSPKLNLLGNAGFNHLNIILTLLMCGPRLTLNLGGPIFGIFFWWKSGNKVWIQGHPLWYHDKHQFPQKLKLLGNCEFNHLTIILTILYLCRFKQRFQENVEWKCWIQGIIFKRNSHSVWWN